MEVCKCGREFKSNAGLARHKQSCSNKPLEYVAEDEVVELNEVVESAARKIRKLRDAWKSTPDAESRYNIECEIKELEVYS